MGQQVEAILEFDSSKGKLLSFVESHTQVLNREFEGDQVIIRAMIGKQTLEDLSESQKVLDEIARFEGSLWEAEAE